MSKEPTSKHDAEGGNGMTRRRFLQLALLSSAGLLASCVAGEVAQEPAPYRTPTPFRVLASPQAPAQATPQAAVPGSIPLDQFMQLSSLLTGVDGLDPELGRVYLSALEAGGGAAPSLADLYEAASSGSGPANSGVGALPQDLDALNQAGFFQQEGMGKLADQIITLWYTGVYKVGEEEKVATFVDALAWKVLHFTKPLTICGEFGFWSREPQVEISPSIQYTPVPTQAGGGGG